jgi:repressor LexA
MVTLFSLLASLIHVKKNGLMLAQPFVQNVNFTQWIDTARALHTVNLYGMPKLTHRQKQIVDFIDRHQHSRGVAPTLTEIATHFAFRSVTTVADHLRLIRQKGFLAVNEPKQARSLRVVSPLHALRKRLVDIPLYGSIPAGFADDRTQEAKGCISVDIETIGIKPTRRTFALEVRGDSMIGKHILDGDTVVLEHGMTPRNGDVVAALIDNESTLKTFVMECSRPFLRAENPRYPKMIPASELVIQGVVVALIRKRK